MNNKHEDIVFLIAYYFIRLTQTLLQQREKAIGALRKPAIFAFFKKGVPGLLSLFRPSLNENSNNLDSLDPKREATKIDRNLPITSELLFPERSAYMIDGCEKLNC